MISKKKDQIVIGIGASAGGLEALQDFFKAMPLDTGFAFVVIQHLSPDYKSLMDELLARYTKLRILIASESMPVEPDTIYLIPPRKNLSIFHNKLILEDQSIRKGLNLPVDIFLRSLAAEKGKNAIGIILSGTGSDGTLGTRAVKEAGGMMMVQDEQSAKFDGMPRSSISTGLVDYVLPPDRMAEELLNYTKHPFVRKSRPIESILSKDLDTLTKITLILRDYSGIDFSYYKENTIIRRLERRVSINRFDTLEQYLLYLSESDKEKDILYKELLIGVTRFFRDTEAFTSFKENVLPKLFTPDKSYLRVWSTGCSTGEEVYSLAMFLQNYKDSNNLDCDIKIFATDVDRKALEQAGSGFYPDSIISDVEQNLLTRYFSRRDNGYQVNENIRKMVVFATHNLIKDPPFSKLDLIVCRNLFIYLKPDMQSRILSLFYSSLNSDSFLFMGNSETIGELSDAFSAVDSRWKIYRKKEGYRIPALKDLPIPQRQFSDIDRLHSSNKGSYENIKFDKLMESVVSSFVPPSVIIDSNDNIIQVLNDINKFIKLKPGRFSQNIFSILSGELSVFVNNLLRKLKKENKEVVFENISGLEGFKGKKITVRGRVLDSDKNRFYMLSFSSSKDEALPETKNPELMDVKVHYTSRVTELEKELQFTRESLQATVEELETSNEELQSSNEELIASNEELQSTNEELQSVNEELYTVNSEYQIKIDELTKLNNDVNNLLKNTEVGALYLDRNLCIRKITPVVSKITNIISSDIGRPLSHLALIKSYDTILSDVEKVVETLSPVDKEIIDSNGINYLTRIRPYRTEYNSVEGILITFVDISRIKQLEKDLVESRDMLQRILDNSPLAKTFVDSKGSITYVNKKGEELFGITQEQVRGRSYDSAAWEISDLEGNPINPEDLPFSIIKKTGKEVFSFKHYIKIPDRDKVLLCINGAPIINEDGIFEGAVFSISYDNLC